MSEIAHGIIDGGILQQYLDTAKALVDEAKVHFGDDGLFISAVEPANVAMWQEVSLAPRAFEHYESPGQATIGLNLVRFDDLLGSAGANDPVNLTVNMETRMLDIEYRTIKHSMALIDPDAIRDEPDEPELDLPNSVTLEGRQVADAVAAAEMVSDHLTIAGRPDEREVRVTAEGDTDETIVTFGDEDCIDARVSEAAESKFSVPYMDSISGVCPADAEVTITFGDEFPIRMEWSDCEGALTARAMVAPRIDTS